MKILHIITDLKDGGAEAVLHRLIQTQTDYLHRVVCLGDGGKYVSIFFDMGIVVDVLDLKSGALGVVRGFKLRQIVAEFNPDLIQGWMYHGNLAAGLYGLFNRRIPVYWGIHHTNLMPKIDPLSTRFVSWCCAMISNAVPKAIICCGERSKSVHAEQGYAAGKLCVIPNGYDTSKFVPDDTARQEIRRNCGISSEAFVLGTVGRYAAQKDHNNLLQALAGLAEEKMSFQCLLVGTDMDHTNSTLMERITALGLEDKVHLLGRRDDVEKVMCSLDVHVTSSAFGEAFPNVICEAMSCETVCVTTDVGDAAFIVDDTGFVVRPSDPDALKTAVKAAYHRKNLTTEWAVQRCRARQRIVDNFSVVNMAESYARIWLES